MREDLTEIICIVDKSGSMDKVKHDTIGGFNQFLEGQKQEDGDANFTLVLFDTKNKIVYNGTPIQEVEPLNEDTYRPGGWTGLFDAVGVGIDATLDRRESTPEDERAGKVIMAILTDGEENSSKEYRREDVFRKIDEQRDNGWEFIFLGANQEAINSGQSIGIKSDKIMAYVGSAEGTRAAYACSLGDAIKSFRQTGNVGTDWKSDSEIQS